MHKVLGSTLRDSKNNDSLLGGGTVSHFSIVEKRCQEQGSYWKRKCRIGGMLTVSEVWSIIIIILGNMATCRKGWGSTSLSPDPQVGHRGLAWAFETSASLQLHSSSNKTISPNLFQIVSLPNDKAFRTGALRAVVIQTTTGTLRIQRSLKRMCFPFHFPGDEDIKIYIWDHLLGV